MIRGPLQIGNSDQASGLGNFFMTDMGQQDSQANFHKASQRGLIAIDPLVMNKGKQTLMNSSRNKK